LIQHDGVSWLKHHRVIAEVFNSVSVGVPQPVQRHVVVIRLYTEYWGGLSPARTAGGALNQGHVVVIRLYRVMGRLIPSGLRA